LQFVLAKREDELNFVFERSVSKNRWSKRTLNKKIPKGQLWQKPTNQKGTGLVLNQCSCIGPRAVVV